MLTQEQLKSVLEYLPETGLFIWRVSRGSAKAGTLTGQAPVGRGYRAVRVLGARYYAHRLAWFYQTGRWPQEVDHINLDCADNRWCNLRESDRSENRYNRAVQKNNKLGLKGVDEYQGKYRATICIRGKRSTIGMFDSPQEAKAAADEARRQHHKQFARG